MKLNAKQRLIATKTPVNAGIAEHIDKLKNASAKAKEALKKELYHKVHETAQNLKITKEAVLKAYEEPRMLHILEACGYSFATMYGAFSAASNLAHHGVMHTLVHVVEHEGLHKAGHAAGHRAKAVDRVLSKHPLLKKLAGPALAGVMLYGYATGPTSKSLHGWDLTNVKKALTGDYTVSELLQSPEVVTVAASLATGKGFSLTSLAENMSTLTIGLACNAIIHSKHPKLAALASQLKDSADRFRAKGTPLEDIASSKEFKPDPSITDKPQNKEQPKESKKDTNPAWFDAMSPEKQKEYLDNHPNSIYHTAALLKDPICR